MKFSFEYGSEGPIDLCLKGNQKRSTPQEVAAAASKPSLNFALVPGAGPPCSRLLRVSLRLAN